MKYESFRTKFQENGKSKRENRKYPHKNAELYHIKISVPDNSTTNMGEVDSDIFKEKKKGKHPPSIH